MAENTWHLTNIPRIAYFYWGTKEFPWVRYLTLETFRKHHPDWEMVLHRKFILDDYGNTEQQQISCWDKIKNLDIKIECIDVEEELKIDLPIKYITIYADLYRYIVLKKTGGFYVDLDNLFWRSLDSMYFNDPKHVDVKTFLLPPPYHHILLSQSNAPLLDKIQQSQLNHIPQTSNQILNSTACTSWIKPDSSDGIALWPMETTEDNFGPSGPKSDRALCLNWHGSGTYGKYMEVTEANYMESDHALAAVIRYCLHGDTGKVNDLGQFQWINRGG